MTDGDGEEFGLGKVGGDVVEQVVDGVVVGEEGVVYSHEFRVLSHEVVGERKCGVLDLPRAVGVVDLGLVF